MAEGIKGFVEKSQEVGTGIEVNEVDIAPAVSASAVPIEERLYHALLQRRSYGMHSQDPCVF